MKRYTNKDIHEFEIALEEMQSSLLREGKLRKSSRNATPGMTAWPALNNNNNPYHAYRFGMALAGAPDSTTVTKEGPVGGDFVTMSYTDGDDQILKSAAKQFGISNKSMGSSKKSIELDDVHKASPVANKKRNRYGI
jgi:hypothetical protein